MIPNGHSLDYIPYTLGASTSALPTQPNNLAHMSESGLLFLYIISVYLLHYYNSRQQFNSVSNLLDFLH